MAPRIVLFGAGGHAAVVVDLLRARATLEPLEIAGLVGVPSETGDVLGVPMLGCDAGLREIVQAHRVTHFIVAVGTLLGGGGLRPRLFDMGRQAGLAPFTAIHPAATVAASALIGQGATVMAGTVVQARALIGENAILNTRVGVDHDCWIGAHAHLAPGVTCSGGVAIGERAHVGSGAVVVQNVRIGEDATVGAGATVLRDCPPGQTVAGTPATPVRR